MSDPAMHYDLLLAKIAEANDGIVGRKEALASGCTRRTLERRLASGLLVPMHPGVYRMSSHPDSFRARVRAAFIWADDGALLTGGTALALHGLEAAAGEPIQLYVTNGKLRPGLKVKRMDPGEFARRPFQGMWTTTIERSLLDACISQSAPEVGKALDDALRRRLTSVEMLRREVAGTSRGSNGVAGFRQLVKLRDLDDASVRSELETRMLKILRRIRACRFVPNYDLTVGGSRYVLDFAVPELRLGIECHSRRWHGTERVTSDAARDRAIKRAGWTLLYFTWDEVSFAPDRVKAEIEAFLATLF